MHFEKVLHMRALQKFMGYEIQGFYFDAKNVDLCIIHGVHFP